MNSYSLSNLKIASPCSQSWDSMQGDERTRFCTVCSKNVYNISDMSGDEATEFLSSQLETPCIRLFRRHDGTILTDDCPEGLRKIRNKYRLFKKIVSGAVASFLSSMPAWAQVEQYVPSISDPPAVPGTVDMGGITPPEGVEAEEITDELKTDKKKKSEWKKAIRKQKSELSKAALYQSIGEQDKAIGQMEKAIKKHPDDESLLHVLIDFLEKRGKKADIARASKLRKQAKEIEERKQRELEAWKKKQKKYSIDDIINGAANSTK